jgi:hypothetical protein
MGLLRREATCPSRVANVAEERGRRVGLGPAVSEIERVERVVARFDLADPDGNPAESLRGSLNAPRSQRSFLTNA